LKIVWSSVLFNPDKDFFNNFSNVINTSENVLTAIFDNSTKVNKSLNIRSSVDYFCAEGINHGLGVALNRIGKYANSINADWLVYFDQDSYFDNLAVSEIINLLKNYDINEMESLASISFRSTEEKTINTHNCFHKVVMPQGSAIAFNVSVLKYIGFHDEKIFLDCLDYYYDFEVRSKGYYQLVYSCIPGIDHLKLQPSESLNFFGKKVRLFLYRSYPGWRRKQTIFLSFKLILNSILKLDMIFLFFIVRFLLVYIVLQLWYEVKHG